jgi:hypothetical protein
MERLNQIFKSGVSGKMQIIITKSLINELKVLIAIKKY